MCDVTQILSQIESGDPLASEKLLPLVYEELRKLAAHKMSHEAANHTLQATALVHEAYLRLVDGAQGQHWNSRRHFFGAAAEAMRRILVERARRRARVRHGGDLRRQNCELAEIAAPNDQVGDLLSLDAVLDRLDEQDHQAAELVKLRYFAGLTIPQAADVLGVSPRTADFLWSFARAWLRRELAEE